MAYGKLFIISAPSGAGKTSLINAVLPRLTEHYSIERVVTYTTKTARSTEIPGSDYHFITCAQFEERIANNFFLEWSKVYQAYYGSPRSVIDRLAQGHSSILILDRAGAARVAAQVEGGVYIWIKTAGIDQIERQIRGRSTETEQQIQFRLALARQEIEEENQKQWYTHHIVNDQFERAQCELQELIIRELETAKTSSERGY